VASRFTFKRVPLSLYLVKRRGNDPTIHIAGFRDVPVCLTSKGAATAREAPSYERVDGEVNCAACEQWAQAFETSWIKGGDLRRGPKPSS
jgi:hypothetical protein